MVYLADFDKGHIDKTFEWIQDPELRHSFLMRGIVSYDNHVEYFKNVLRDHTRKIYAIFYEQLHVGNCGIKHLNLKAQSAEVWIYIGENSLRKKGIGDAALKLLLRKCFNDLSLEMVYLHVADFNFSAIRLYEKNGFIKVNFQDNAEEWVSCGCKVLRLELGRSGWM